MNVRKYMKAHSRFVAKRLQEELSAEELQSLKENHARLIQYMQHERLIHLLITLSFALFTLITLGFVLFRPCLPVFILLGLFLILLIPYIFHYYFLENTVQHWYALMDEIEQKGNR